MEDQCNRFKRIFGGGSRVECIPMDLIYRDKLNSEGERDRVEKLEMLDEVEEWNLLQSHYCICLGSRGDEVLSSVTL